MTEENAPPEDVVGDDRNPSGIARSLVEGMSVVVSGPLGSGKSFLLNRVAQLVAGYGLEPLILHSGGPLQTDSLGALAVITDPREARLQRAGSQDRERHLVIVVDDAQDLDDASAEMLARAAYSARATVLLGVTVSRCERERREMRTTSATQMAIDLWLRGRAVRVDLTELDRASADELLDRMVPASVDSVTRAMIVTLSDGSRTVLRELAAVATNSVRAGSDPLDAIRKPIPRGGLSDALAAHGAQLADEERRVLAFIGRVPGIAHADAIRFVAASILDSLIARALIFDDHTPHHYLTANPAVVYAVEQNLDPSQVDSLVDVALTRMLEARGQWWSEAIGRLAALRWHAARRTTPTWAEVPAELRARALLAAASVANDLGQWTLGNAYATLGLAAVDSAEMRLERLYARTGQGTATGPPLLKSTFDFLQLPARALLRCMTMSSRMRQTTTGGELARASAQAATALHARADSDPEMAIAVAQCAALNMDWRTVLSISEAVYSTSTGNATIQYQAAMLSGVGNAHQGDWHASRRWFALMHHVSEEQSGSARISTQARLIAEYCELHCFALSGADPSELAHDQGTSRVRAVQENNAIDLVISGLVAAKTAATLGDSVAAARELAATGPRARRLGYGTWMPFIELAIARSLAITGQTARARLLLDSIDPADAAGSALVQHALLRAESVTCAAEERVEEALAAAHAASALSQHSPSLHLQDQCVVIALGGADAEVMERTRGLANSLDLPSARILVDRAAIVMTMGSRGVVDLLSVWSQQPHVSARNRGRSGDDGRSAPTSAQHFGQAALRLTRREREIARLIGDGMSNRQIAEVLFVSVRTVESHIYQARVKLGARSRQDLSDLVAPLAPSSHRQPLY